MLDVKRKHMDRLVNTIFTKGSFYLKVCDQSIGWPRFILLQEIKSCLDIIEKLPSQSICITFFMIDQL